MRVAGIMSGTSLDGIDVAIVDIAGKRIDTVAHSTTPYSERAFVSAFSKPRRPADISRLNFELGELYAKAVIKACKRAKIPVESLELIGSHGQTIYHEGSHNTLQIGEAAVIAERLGIPVVSDFRTRDIAAGGQGAPLVPFVDLLLFSTPKTKRVALNIGGIANITILPRRRSAFDTGPGNMVIDQLVERLTQGKQRFDRNGHTAAKGHINRPLLDSLLADKYYKAKPPKTAGREQYGSAFVDRLVATGLPMEDLIATATALTAATIAARHTSPQAKSSHPEAASTTASSWRNSRHFSPTAASPQPRNSASTRRQRSHRLRHPRASHLASPHGQSSRRNRRAQTSNPREGHVSVKWTS